MSIISFSELSQSFGHFDIFAGITGRIEHDSRIGLVGPNGVGKTSLIHILAGIEPPPTGTLSVKRGLTVTIRCSRYSRRSGRWRTSCAHSNTRWRRTPAKACSPPTAICSMCLRHAADTTMSCASSRR
ncbi:ATP-binding cassette domain-containing protein [Anaerolineae bacterium CFX4]|nr:ATP-binding cassette domain-containing protein [Anaerolineae bacterium CFX4]